MSQNLRCIHPTVWVACFGLHLAHLLLEDILGRHAAYANWRKAHAWGLWMLRYGTEGRLISYYT